MHRTHELYKRDAVCYVFAKLGHSRRDIHTQLVLRLLYAYGTILLTYPILQSSLHMIRQLESSSPKDKKPD